MNRLINEAKKCLGEKLRKLIKNDVTQIQSYSIRSELSPYNLYFGNPGILLKFTAEAKTTIMGFQSQFFL